MKFLVILCLLGLWQGSGAGVADSIYGTYRLIYRWPKINRQIPNCSEAVFSKAAPELEDSVSCRCERSGEQALLHVDAPGKKMDFAAEIVTDLEELKAALDNKCTCTPSVKARTVIYKVSDDYILQYIPWLSSTFLHGRVVPSAEERADLISRFPHLRDTEGSLFCV